MVQGRNFYVIKIKSILDILIYAYNFWAPIIVIPLVAALFRIRTSTRAFLVGSAAGLTGVILWNNLLGTPSGVDGLVVGALTNLLAFTLYSKIENNKNAKSITNKETKR